MTLEREIEFEVQDWAEQNGWHVRPLEYRGRRGCPDRIFFGHGTIRLIEFKKPGGRLSDRFYEVPEESRLASRIGVFVEHEKDGEKVRVPVSEWIRNDKAKKAMPPTHWVYGGSEFYRGTFIPETTGEIAAIFITNTALLNFAGTDNLDDEVWTVMTSQVPEIETKVTLVFAPYKEP